MAEESFIWEAGGGGDASPYSEADSARVMGILAGAVGENAVIRGYLNELAPSLQSGDTQIRVESGAAVADGHPYVNDAAITTTPTTPTVGTTGRRMVLDCNWSTQTVRLTELTSADGTSALPALTQNAGVRYQVPICSYAIATSGAISSFSDDRAFAGGSGLANEKAFWDGPGEDLEDGDNLTIEDPMVLATHTISTRGGDLVLDGSLTTDWQPVDGTSIFVGLWIDGVSKQADVILAPGSDPFERLYRMVGQFAVDPGEHTAQFVAYWAAGGPDDPTQKVQIENISFIVREVEAAS